MIAGVGVAAVALIVGVLNTHKDANIGAMPEFLQNGQEVGSLMTANGCAWHKHIGFYPVGSEKFDDG